MLQKFISAALLTATMLLAETASPPPISYPPVMDPIYGASASLKVNGGCNFFITGSFVYYQAFEEQLDLAYTYMSNVTYGGDGLRYIYKMDFDYKPGFKVKAGYRFNHDKWEINAEYLWYHIKNSASYNLSSISRYTFPFFNDVTGALNNYVRNSHTSATWHLDLDMVDLYLVRPFYSGTKLTFKPFLGLRGLFITQKYNQTISALLNNGTAFTPYYHGKNESWAVGPRVGVDGQWRFTDCFRLFGNGAAALAYSHYDLSYKNYDEAQSNTPKIFSKETDQNRLRPMAELMVGLGYGTYFSNYKFHLDINLGYDFYAFWDQEMLQDLVRAANIYADLYIHGATANVQFDLN